MLNFLVETKQEYTTQLINVLTPLIYEGLQSIYQDALKISTPDNILKNFQSFLQRVPKWNNEIISNDTQRIMNNSKSYGWLEDLIKATLKANIIVLTYNPTVRNQVKIDPTLYQNVKLEDFIHKIYIECARELWNNPYLFYHNYPPIELKRNQRDSIQLIKDCIKEAIRKILPVKYILNIYLGEELATGQPDDNFDRSISEIEGKNLDKLIKKDLYGPSKEFNVDSITINGQNAKQTPINQEIKQDGHFIKAIGYEPKTEESNVTVGSKILEIINNKDIKLTENKTSEHIPDTLDNKINNIVQNLDDTETSISLNPKQNFQEVYSNKDQMNIQNNIGPNQNKYKAKFFSNYLNIA
jgi:hypothetical protein